MESAIESLNYLTSNMNKWDQQTSAKAQDIVTMLSDNIKRANSVLLKKVGKPRMHADCADRSPI